MLALGLGMLVSAISLENRDWERVLGYGLTVGLWLSPVIYAPDMIPHAIRDVYHLNPVAGPLLAFRAVLFDGVPFPLWEWTYALVVSFVVLVLGMWAFRRTEVRLADCL
jgi:lipopolysaccharide transport system permease protein